MAIAVEVGLLNEVTRRVNAIEPDPVTGRRNFNTVSSYLNTLGERYVPKALFDRVEQEVVEISD
jgi:hypothetical protein